MAPISSRNDTSIDDTATNESDGSLPPNVEVILPVLIMSVVITFWLVAAYQSHRAKMRLRELKWERGGFVETESGDSECCWCFVCEHDD